MLVSSDDNSDTGPDHPDRESGTEGLRLLGLLLTVRAQSVRSPCAVTQSRRAQFVIPRTWMLIPMVFLFSGEQSIKHSSLNSDPLDPFSPIFG